MQHPRESLLARLPPPDTEALALSQRLRQRLQDAAGEAGRLPFDRFMELALYAPGLGYYANGLRKFGEAGDFVTAPEMSPLFGRCLARQCAETLERLGGGDILEFGAGSGRLVVDVLAELQRLQRLPGRYRILELSASLQARQRETLQAELPGLLDRVEWLQALPADFTGVVVANEVLDAMPVSRFRVGEQSIEEQWVELGAESRLAWCPARSPGLAEAGQALAQRYDLPLGYASEVNLRAAPWLAALGQALKAGLVLLIDYGYNGREFYHPERDRGTLVCHYRHRVHDDPLLWPGLQDITANVDFTALAEAAPAAGFDSLAFTSQAYFLLATGIEQLIEPEEPKHRLRDLQAVKRLTLPNEMGERFKVLGLGKGLDRLPLGFRLRDYAL